MQADEEKAARAMWLKWARWPIGRRVRPLCLFFGPTPASRGDEIRAASAVNVTRGIIDGDCYGAEAGEEPGRSVTVVSKV